MKPSSETNRRYWDRWNKNYSQVWQSPARRIMSRREMSFISSTLRDKKPDMIMDIGIGNGRVLETLSEKSNARAKIYGIDISKEMIKVCLTRFKGNKKIKSLRVCDLSSQDIPFDQSFDFVTAIRVLKYNKNWHSMIRRVFNSLNRGGVFIFTMPNRQSISAFSGDKFSESNTPIIYTNMAELRSLSSKIGFSKVEFISFSKLPNFLYHISANNIFVNFLLNAEFILEKLFGKSFLGRELFVICTK